jgi:hypothetical protein
MNTFVADDPHVTDQVTTFIEKFVRFLKQNTTISCVRKSYATEDECRLHEHWHNNAYVFSIILTC